MRSGAAAAQPTHKPRANQTQNAHNTHNTRGAFVQVANALQQALPGVEVIGSTYPLSRTQALAAQAVGVAQLGALAAIFAGDQIFAALGAGPPPPAWLARLTANKPTAALGAWLGGNMLTSAVTGTGAFEIYFDGDLVSSKLATGRFPTEAEFGALVRRIVDAVAAEPQRWRPVGGLPAAAAAAAAVGGGGVSSSDGLPPVRVVGAGAGGVRRAGGEE